MCDLNVFVTSCWTHLQYRITGGSNFLSASFLDWPPTKRTVLHCIIFSRIILAALWLFHCLLIIVRFKYNKSAVGWSCECKIKSKPARYKRFSGGHFAEESLVRLIIKFSRVRKIDINVNRCSNWKLFHFTSWFKNSNKSMLLIDAVSFLLTGSKSVKSLATDQKLYTNFLLIREK